MVHITNQSLIIIKRTLINIVQELTSANWGQRITNRGMRITKLELTVNNQVLRITNWGAEYD